MSHRGPTVLSALIFVSVLASVTGCRHFAQYDAAEVPSYSYQCDAEVTLLSDAATVPDLRFDYLGVGKPAELPELVRFVNSNRPVELYRSTLTPGKPAPWVAQGVVPEMLRGSWLVRLDVADRTVAGTLLRVDFNAPEKVGTVWVGFDTRGFAPDWLQRAFTPADPPAELETTKRTATDEPVRFKLWRLRDTVDLARTLELGGNADTTATWPGGTPGEQYLVFVHQKPIPDASNITVVLGEHRVEKCTSNGLEWVETAFGTEDLSTELDDWVGHNSGWAWAREAKLLSITALPSTCAIVEETKNGQTVSKTCDPNAVQQSGLTTINTWRVISTASVDPSASFGAIAINGDRPTGTALAGRVSFASHEDGLLELDEISLWAEPFHSGGFDVAWATFGQLRTVEAECIGQSFPHLLCDGYRIGDGGLELFATARVGGHLYSATLVNEGPVEIEVDLNQREFHFNGGPFEGEVRLENGSELAISAELTVGGAFDNFAPVPLTDEGGDRFACVDNRSGRVRLDAGASVDAEGSLVEILWIEDAGLSTQRLLGAGDVVEVDLGLGVHDVTLVVEDGDGVRAFTRTTVEVFDDELDSVSFPADAWAVTSGDPSRGTFVALGSAAGADACSGGVLVNDDGPGERTFDDGLSLVSWTVDNGNGHVARQSQRVLVVPAAAAPPPNAWIAADAMVGPGGILHVDYGTYPVGHGVLVDEYLLITAPDGLVYSVDARGVLSSPGRPAPRASGVVRGAAPSSGSFALTEPGRLGEEGIGGVELVLVLPGDDPLDRKQIVGWDGRDWRLLR